MDQRTLDLIDTVIGDGDLEQEELDLLRRKAVEYGDDPVEAVATAKTMLRKNESKRKESFTGEVKKCPHCGEVVDGYAKTCASCGKLIAVGNLETYMNEYEKAFGEAEGNISRDLVECRNFKKEIGIANKYLRKIKSEFGKQEEVQDWLLQEQKRVKSITTKQFFTANFITLLLCLFTVIGGIVTLFGYMESEDGIMVAGLIFIIWPLLILGITKMSAAERRDKLDGIQ